MSVLIRARGVYGGRLDGLTFPVKIPLARADQTVVPISYFLYNGLEAKGKETQSQFDFISGDGIVANIIGETSSERTEMTYAYSFSGRSRCSMLEV